MTRHNILTHLHRRIRLGAKVFGEIKGFSTDTADAIMYIHIADIEAERVLVSG
jgi:hypothetical protein